MKSVKVRRKKKTLLKAVAFFAALAGIFVFLKNQKELVIRQGTLFLESLVHRQTYLTLKIGRVSGNLFGRMTIEDIRVDENTQAGPRPVFRCPEVQIQYSFFDFISKFKKEESSVTVTAARPEVFWRPHINVRRSGLSLFAWLRDWALARRRQFTVRAEGLVVYVGERERQVGPLDLIYRNNGFELIFPLRHLSFHGADISTTLNASGQFAAGLEATDDLISGSVYTEGTIVNWQPLAAESSFHFAVSRDQARIVSTDFLGGIQMDGGVGFSDFDIDFLIEALDFPLSHFNELAGVRHGLSIPGRASFDIHFTGTLWAPAVDARCRIYEGQLGHSAFQAMDLNFAGAYPTVRLSESRVLLKDGTVMRFADKTLEVRDLFDTKTFNTLVGEAQQDTVVWGDWELSRRVNEDELSDVVMQRAIGENVRLHVGKSNALREVPEISGPRLDSSQLEFGFEYRLKSEDALKLELRDGEEFVGVERKMKF